MEQPRKGNINDLTPIVHPIGKTDDPTPRVRLEGGEAGRRAAVPELAATSEAVGPFIEGCIFHPSFFPSYCVIVTLLLLLLLLLVAAVCD